MTFSPEEPFGSDAVLDRLLEAPSTETSGSGELARLAALLAAAAAPSGTGPQPGEATVLSAFRELVTEGAGTPSLSARRARLRVAAVAAGTTLALLGGGVAAAATGSLPDPAQSAAKDVLGAVGVHVPGPDEHAGEHPYQRGHSGKTKTQTPGPADVPNPATPGQPSHPAHPTPAASAPAATPPTPGNSGVSRHHGNPTPASSVQPTPHHGKPSAPPAVSRRHLKPHPTPYDAHARVMQARALAIHR